MNALDCHAGLTTSGDRKTRQRAASLLKLTAAATPAATAEKINVHVVPPTGIAANTSATSAAPVVWPNSLAVACIPLAPPLRAAGADVMIARLFGVLKNPNPTPHNVIRQTMSCQVACSGSIAIAARPAAITTIPQPPNKPAG